MKKNRNLIILDSGVDRKTIKKNNIAVKNFTFESEFDLNGHGTSVYNYIYNRCTDVNIGVYKIINKYGKSSGNYILKALEKLCEEDVDVVCMALSFISSIDPKIKSKIDKKLNKLKNKGVIIICSYENGSCCSYPADSPNVIGVQGAFLTSNYEYWFKDNTMVTNIYPECVKTMDDKIVFFSGNSKACALAVCIILNDFLNVKYNIKLCVVNRLLRDAATLNSWEERMINRDEENMWKIPYDKKAPESMEEDMNYLDILQSKCKINLMLQQAYFEKKGMYYILDNINEFMSSICNAFGIDVRESDIYVYDFINVYQLIHAIKRWRKDEKIQ